MAEGALGSHSSGARLEYLLLRLGRLRNHEQPYNMHGTNAVLVLMVPLAALGLCC